MNRPYRRSGSADQRVTGRIAVAQRKRIRDRDGYRCRRCNIVVLVGEVDHIKPLEHGGTNEDDNLQLLCSECHKVKTATDRGHKVKRAFGPDGCPIDGSW